MTDHLLLHAGFRCAGCVAFGPGKLSYDGATWEYTCAACGTVYPAVVWEGNVLEYRRLAGLPPAMPAGGGQNRAKSERRETVTTQAAPGVQAAPAGAVGLDKKLAILQAFGTKEAWERIQALLGALVDAERDEGTAKWALHQAEEDARSYELLLMGLADGKNDNERRAAVEKAKAGDERWQAARGRVDGARATSLAASVVLSGLVREYSAWCKFLDLRAAQLRFLAG